MEEGEHWIKIVTISLSRISKNNAMTAPSRQRNQQVFGITS